MTDQTRLRAHITAMLHEYLLDPKTDWGIEFSSNNDLLREVVKTAVDMIED